MIDGPALFLLLAVAFFFGHHFSKKLPRVRQLGVLLGTLTFLGFWLSGYLRSENLPLISYAVVYLFWSATVTAAVWFVVPLVLSFLSGPADLITSTFGFLRPKVKQAYERRSDARQAAALEEARQRIAVLEARPDKLPESADPINALSIEWHEKREQVLAGGHGDSRQQLNRIDAMYGRQLADLLEQQEGEQNG